MVNGVLKNEGLNFRSGSGSSDALLRVQHGADVISTTSRIVTLEEFSDVCKMLLREACIGEPPQSRGIEETFKALKEYFHQHVTVESFARKFRVFHLRPADEVLVPPVAVLRRTFAAGDELTTEDSMELDSDVSRSQVALKTDIFVMPLNSRVQQDQFLQALKPMGFTTLGIPPSRRVFIDRILQGSWATKK